MPTYADLPDGIEALKAMVRQRDTLLAERDVLLAQRDAIIATHTSEIEQLKLLIAKLKRMQFGRRSEKLDLQIEQLELRLEDLQADEGDATAQVEKHSNSPRKSPVRKPLPDHLPREERVYPPAEACCPDCGGDLRHLGDDISEQLEFIPASFKVIRHTRPKLACTCCDAIVQAPAHRLTCQFFVKQCTLSRKNHRGGPIWLDTNLTSLSEALRI
jgi:transposase